MAWIKAVAAGISLLFLVSCKKETSGGGNTTVAASTQLNVAYGSSPLQNMDVYLPANRSAGNTKILVLIHGGSWTSLDKNDLSPYVDSFKKRLPDYAIFNINYRLSAKPNNVFPTQESDVKAALTFIAGKATDYLISDKYALIGFSAGAHLAMLQGYKYAVPVVPKAIASFSGPTDLLEMYNHPVGGNSIISIGLADAVGSTPAQDSLLYANSSPVNFITATSPATIIFHGGKDPLVSTTQPMEVQEKLGKAGVKNQYVFYASEGHIGSWTNASMLDAFNKLQAFIIASVL